MSRGSAHAAPPGDYNVSINNQGTFHLDQTGGRAQYRDGIVSVQSTLEYRDECTWKGVRCSAFRETSYSGPGGNPKYGWLFAALQSAGGQQQSQVGFVALEDIDREDSSNPLEAADVLPFGNAVYTPVGGATNLNTLRKILKK